MFVLPGKNIALLDFNDVYVKSIDTQLLNDLNSLQLISNNTINLDNRLTSRVFTHCVIFGLCEHIISVKQREKIAIFVSEDFKQRQFQIFDFISPEIVFIEVQKRLKKLKKLLPLNIYFSDSTVNQVKEDITQKTGKGKEIINMIEDHVSVTFDKPFTFNEIKKYAEKNGLTFLSSDYFNKLKNKQLIYSA